MYIRPQVCLSSIKVAKCAPHGSDALSLKLIFPPTAWLSRSGGRGLNGLLFNKHGSRRRILRDDRWGSHGYWHAAARRRRRRRYSAYATKHIIWRAWICMYPSSSLGRCWCVTCRLGKLLVDLTESVLTSKTISQQSSSTFPIGDAMSFLPWKCGALFSPSRCKCVQKQRRTTWHRFILHNSKLWSPRLMPSVRAWNKFELGVLRESHLHLMQHFKWYEFFSFCHTTRVAYVALYFNCINFGTTGEICELEEGVLCFLWNAGLTKLVGLLCVWFTRVTWNRYCHWPVTSVNKFCCQSRDLFK